MLKNTDVPSALIVGIAVAGFAMWRGWIYDWTTAAKLAVTVAVADGILQTWQFSQLVAQQEAQRAQAPA